MFTQRHRPVVYSVAALAVIWVLTVAGYHFAQGFEITADKVRAYDESMDVTRLDGGERAAALQKLAGMLNALPLDERQPVWADIMPRWFAATTPAEKAQFLAVTALPGLKQNLSPFDQLPPERRQQAMDDRLRQLREAREHDKSDRKATADTGTNMVGRASP